MLCPLRSHTAGLVIQSVLTDEDPRPVASVRMQQAGGPGGPGEAVRARQPPRQAGTRGGDDGGIWTSLHWVPPPVTATNRHLEPAGLGGRLRTWS